MACVPRAWAAAAPVLFLQALLGISAHAAGNTLTVDRPMLPDWLASVELCDVRIAGSRVSLSFQRSRPGITGFSVLELNGDVRVTMSA